MQLKVRRVNQIKEYLDPDAQKVKKTMSLRIYSFPFFGFVFLWIDFIFGHFSADDKNVHQQVFVKHFYHSPYIGWQNCEKCNDVTGRYSSFPQEKFSIEENKTCTSVAYISKCAKLYLSQNIDWELQLQ